MLRLRRVPPIVLLLVCARLLCADGPNPSELKKPGKKEDEYVYFHVIQYWTTRTTLAVRKPDNTSEVLAYETTLEVHWHPDVVAQEKDKKTTSKVVGLKSTPKKLTIQEKKNGKYQDLDGEAKQAFDALKAQLLKTEWKFALKAGGHGYEVKPSGPAEPPAEEKQLRASLLTDPVVGLPFLLAPPVPQQQETFKEGKLQKLEVPPYGSYQIEHSLRKGASKGAQVMYPIDVKIAFVAATGEGVGARVTELRLNGTVALNTSTGLVTELKLGTRAPVTRRVDLRVGGENLAYEVKMEYETTMTATLAQTP